MALTIHSDTLHTAPVAAATVMVVRDGASGLEVLLVRRHGNSGVLGGVHVFPGGKLDAADLWREGSPADHSPQACALGLNEPGLDPGTAWGLHVAALRETFEESGLLLGQVHRPGLAPRLRALTSAGTPFGAALHQLGCPLSLASVLPWSRWITPRAPSVTHRRFDTRFFVAAAPTGQVVEHCAFEATEAVWLAPRVGLERYWAGEIDLAPPQIMSLGQLCHLHSVGEVLALAASRAPALIEPEPFDQDGMRVICYPGDPAHSVAARIWPGPTRLMFRNRRFEAEGGLAALLGLSV